MRPEERDAVCAISALERPFKTLRVFYIGCDHLGTQLCQRLRFSGIDISRNCAGREAAALVAQYGADQSTTLGACGAYYCNNLLFSHDCPSNWFDI